MRELLRNAWLGWQNYTDDGKLAALLLAALLFLWLRNKKVSQKGFLSYAVLMTACCIFPVTAVLLMLYQTKFYDYQWIWSLVPVTPVIAWGITEFLTEEAVVKGESAGKGPKKEGSYFPLRPACFLPSQLCLCFCAEAWGILPGMWRKTRHKERSAHSFWHSFPGRSKALPCACGAPGK